MGLPVSAEGLGVRGPRGWVFRDVDLVVPAGALAAVAGPSGSGRSSLLLTLAGRMRATDGQARIGEHALPGRLRPVQAVVGLGVFAGVNDLDEPLTVADMVREQLSLRRVRRRRDVTGVLTRVGLDLPGGTRIRDLGRAEHVLLGVALALVGEPEVLVADDVDVRLDAEDQLVVWRTLRAVADNGVTVIASCVDSTVPAQAGLLDVVHLLTSAPAEVPAGRARSEETVDARS